MHVFRVTLTVVYSILDICILYIFTHLFYNNTLYYFLQIILYIVIMLIIYKNNNAIYDNYIPMKHMTMNDENNFILENTKIQEIHIIYIYTQ